MMEECEFKDSFVEAKMHHGDMTLSSVSAFPWKPKCRLHVPRRIFSVIFFLALVFPSEQACSYIPLSDATLVVTSETGNYSLSDVVMLSCNSTGHYTPTGTPFSVCIGNNTWIPDPSTFICHDQCSSDLFHADVEHSSENDGSKSFYDHNEVIQLSCGEGATLKGSDRATCRDGVLEMSSPPECRADCPSPNLVTPMGNYSDGDVASFSCPERTTQPPLATVTCRNGAWDPPFKCFEKCAMPSTLDRGLHLSLLPDKDGLYDHADIITFSCSIHDHVISGVNRSRCNNGNWIPPSLPLCQQEPTQGQSYNESTTQTVPPSPSTQEATTDQESAISELSTTSTVKIQSTTAKASASILTDEYVLETRTAGTDSEATSKISSRNVSLDGSTVTTLYHLTTLIDLGNETTSPNFLETTKATVIHTSSTPSTQINSTELQLPNVSIGTTLMAAENKTDIYNKMLLPTRSAVDYSTEKQVTSTIRESTFPHTTAGGTLLPDFTTYITTETLQSSDEPTIATDHITEIKSTEITGSTNEHAEQTTMNYNAKTLPDTTKAADKFTEVIGLVVDTSEPITAKELTSQAEHTTEPYLSITREAPEDRKTPRPVSTEEDTYTMTDIVQNRITTAQSLSEVERLFPVTGYGNTKPNAGTLSTISDILLSDLKTELVGNEQTTTQQLNILPDTTDVKATLVTNTVTHIGTSTSTILTEDPRTREPVTPITPTYQGYTTTNTTNTTKTNFDTMTELVTSTIDVTLQSNTPEESVNQRSYEQEEDEMATTISTDESSTREHVTQMTPTYKVSSTTNKAKISTDTVTILVTESVDVTFLSDSQEKTVNQRGYQLEEGTIVTKTTASEYLDTSMATEGTTEQEPAFLSDLEASIIETTDHITTSSPTKQAYTGTTNEEQEISIKTTLESGEPSSEFSTDVKQPSSTAYLPTSETTSEQVVISTEMTYSEVVTGTALITQGLDLTARSTISEDELRPTESTNMMTKTDKSAIQYPSTQLTDMQYTEKYLDSSMTSEFEGTHETLFKNMITKKDTPGTTTGYITDEFEEKTEPGRVNEIINGTRAVTRGNINDTLIVSDRNNTVVTQMYTDVMTSLVPESTRTFRDLPAEKKTVMSTAATEEITPAEQTVADNHTTLDKQTTPKSGKELRTIELTTDVTSFISSETTSRDGILVQYTDTTSQTETSVSSDMVTYITDETLDKATSEVLRPRGHATELDSTIISTTIEESSALTTTKHDVTEAATVTDVEFATETIDETVQPSGRGTLAVERGFVTKDETTISTDVTIMGTDIMNILDTHVKTSNIPEETSNILPDSLEENKTTTSSLPITHEPTSKQVTAITVTNVDEATLYEFVTEFVTIQDIELTTDETSFISSETTSRGGIVAQYSNTTSETETSISSDMVTYITDEILDKATSEVLRPRGHATELDSAIVSTTIEESSALTATKHDKTEAVTVTDVEFATATIDETVQPSVRETLAVEGGFVTEDETTISTDATIMGTDITNILDTHVKTSYIPEETSNIPPDSLEENKTTTSPLPITHKPTSKQATAITVTNADEATLSEFVTEFVTIQDYELTPDETSFISSETTSRDGIVAQYSNTTSETETSISSDMITYITDETLDKATAEVLRPTIKESSTLTTTRSTRETLAEEAGFVTEDETSERTDVTIMGTDTTNILNTAIYTDVKTSNIPEDTSTILSDSRAKNKTTTTPMPITYEITSKQATAGTDTNLGEATLSEFVTEFVTIQNTTDVTPSVSFKTSQTEDIASHPARSDFITISEDVTVTEQEGTPTDQQSITTDMRESLDKTTYSEAEIFATELISEILAPTQGEDTASVVEVDHTVEIKVTTAIPSLTTNPDVTQGTTITVADYISFITDEAVEPSESGKSMSSADASMKEQIKGSTKSQFSTDSMTQESEWLTEIITSVISEKPGNVTPSDDITTKSGLIGTSGTTEKPSQTDIEDDYSVLATIEDMTTIGREMTNFFTEKMKTATSHDITFPLGQFEEVQETTGILHTPMATDENTDIVTPTKAAIVDAITGEKMTGFTTARQMTTEGKMSPEIEWYTEILESSVGSKETATHVLQSNKSSSLPERVTTEFPDVTSTGTKKVLATEIVTDIATQTLTSLKSVSLQEYIATEVPDNFSTSTGNQLKARTEVDQSTTATLTEMIQQVLTDIVSDAVRPTTTEKYITKRITDEPYEMPDTIFGSTDTITEIVTITSNETTEPTEKQTIESISSSQNTTTYKKVTQDTDWYTETITYTLEDDEKTDDIITTVDHIDTRTPEIFEATGKQITLMSLEGKASLTGHVTDEMYTESTEVTSQTLKTEMATEVFTSVLKNGMELSSVVEGMASTKVSYEGISSNILRTEDKSTAQAEATQPVSVFETDLVSTEHSAKLKPLTSPTPSQTSTITKYASETMSDKTTYIRTDLATETYETTEPIVPDDGTLLYTKEEATFAGTDLAAETYDEATEPIVSEEDTTEHVIDLESTYAKVTTEQIPTSEVIEDHTETHPTPHTEVGTSVFTEFITEIFKGTLESSTPTVVTKDEIKTQYVTEKRITPTSSLSSDFSDWTQRVSEADISLTVSDSRKPGISSTPLPFIDSSTDIAEFETVFETVEVPDVTEVEPSTSRTVYPKDTVTIEKELILSTAVSPTTSLITQSETAEVTSLVMTTDNPEKGITDLKTSASTASNTTIATITTDKPTEGSHLPDHSTAVRFETEWLTISEFADQTMTTVSFEERQTPSMVPEVEILLPPTEPTTTEVTPAILQSRTVVSPSVITKLTSERTTGEWLSEPVSVDRDEATEMKSTHKPSTLEITDITTISLITESTPKGPTADSQPPRSSTEHMTSPYTAYYFSVDVTTDRTDRATTKGSTPAVLHSTEDFQVVPTTNVHDTTGQTPIQKTTQPVNVGVSHVTTELSSTVTRTPTTAIQSSAVPTTDIPTTPFPVSTTTESATTEWITHLVVHSTEVIPVVPTTDEQIPTTARPSPRVPTTDIDTTALPLNTNGTDKPSLRTLPPPLTSSATSDMTFNLKTTQSTQSIPDPASTAMKPKCGVKCEGLNEVCIVAAEGDSCRCAEGHERVDGVCKEIFTYKADVKIVLIKGKEALFTPELSDSSSIKFKELEAEFCQAMEKMYKTDIPTTRSFFQCDVIAFRPGSIVVEYMVKFTSPKINETVLITETFVYLKENNMTFPREIALASTLVPYEPANECLLNMSDCDPAAECIDRGPGHFTCKCSPGYDDIYQKQLPGRYCIAIQPLSVSSIVLIVLGIVIFIILIVLLALCLVRLNKRMMGRRPDDYIVHSTEEGLLGKGYRRKNNVEGICYISQQSTLEKREGSMVEVHRYEEEMVESPRSRTDTGLIHTGVQPFEGEEVRVSEEMDRQLQSRMESISQFLKRSAPLNDSSLGERIDYSIMYIPDAPTIAAHERRMSAEQPSEEFLDSLPQTYL